MARILNSVGTTYDEYTLLPGFTPKGCTIKAIDLSTDLGGARLKLPFLSAAMGTVTGEDMVVSLGREGGIGILPLRMGLEDKISTIEKAKNIEMGFVENPVTMPGGSTVEEALKMVKDYGHTKIPVTDRFQVLKGLFTMESYWESAARGRDPVSSIMVPYEKVPKSGNGSISIDKALDEFKKNGTEYLVVLDDQQRVLKMAFKKDAENIPVGAAISTKGNWKESAEALTKAGVDLIVVDTSDGYNEYMLDLIRDYKEMDTGVPLCAGNVVTFEAAYAMMEAGADIIKGGISTGSICITSKEKALGRAAMTTMVDMVSAQEEYLKETGRYVPLIMDGGITSARDMIIAFGFVDAIMMGGYFNRFYEAAGEKHDKDGKPTTIKENIAFVETMGEGSLEARNLGRYSQSQATFFAEGVKGKVPYWGHLKPKLKEDVLKIKAALTNVGAYNLKEFRKNAVFEPMSPNAYRIVAQSHDVL